ncbi:PIN domain-containing protein [Oribacterium sp. NK2B42]|uniref:PIN domain-containing protein n=1 Tax=Oribacterium sp. NK2B42 TaxID=689781 RepID=UPI00041C6BB9|nr:PIN domain-containing protein [Oribacterium sp. NK2B42]
MIILVDFENTHVSGLEGYEYLDDNDTLVMYYSDDNSAVTKGMVNDLKKRNVHVSLVKLLKQHSNALDMYIASTTGMFLESGEKICIVSKDKGYAAVRDFWHSLRGAEILLGETIKECLLSSEKNDDERIRLCKERSQKTNLVDAFATMNTIPTRPTLSKANRRRRGQSINFTEVTEPASLIPNPLMMETPADQLAKQMKDQAAELAQESKSSGNKNPDNNSNKEAAGESAGGSDKKNRVRSEKNSKNSDKTGIKDASDKANASNSGDNLKKESAQEKPKALIKSAPEKTAIIPRPEQRTALAKTEPKFDPNRVQFVYDPASHSMKRVESVFDKKEQETEAQTTDVKAEAQATAGDSSIPLAETSPEADTPVTIAATDESPSANAKSGKPDEEKITIETTDDTTNAIMASGAATEENTFQVQTEDSSKPEKKSSKKSSSAKTKKSENKKTGRKTSKKTEAEAAVKSEPVSNEASKDSGENPEPAAPVLKDETEKKEKQQPVKNTKKTADKSKPAKSKTRETTDSAAASEKEKSDGKAAESKDSSSSSKNRSSSKKESKEKEVIAVSPDMEALQTEALTKYGLTANTLHTYYVRLMKAYGREQGRELYDVSKKAVQEDIKKRKASND